MKIKIVGKNSIKVIYISQEKIVYNINIQFICWGLFSVKNKGIFLVGGKCKDINIYRSDNYECIQTIQNAHNDNILGFIELKNITIISYGWDGIINVWSL